MSGTQCIGRIASRPGDWRAELDFDNGEARIKERVACGLVDIATVPLGEWVPETSETNASLCSDCPQAQRLMKIVFAPEAWATLASIKKDLERKYTTPDAQALAIEDAIDQIERTLECLSVPTNEPDEGPWVPTTPSGDPISGDTRPDGPFQSGSGYGGEPR